MSEDEHISRALRTPRSKTHKASLLRDKLLRQQTSHSRPRSRSSLAPSHSIVRTPMARHSQLLASAAGLLLVLLMAPARPALAGRALLRGGRQLLNQQLSLPCAVLGAPAGPTWMDAPMTCAQLYNTSGMPFIATPQDTDTVKYGQLLYSPTNDGAVAAFIDRLGVSSPISASAHPPTNVSQLLNIWPLIIVQAEIDPKSGNVTAFQPWLYVPYT